MKKTVYVTAFTFLGILLQFVLHASVEVAYIRLLVSDYETYGMGLSWSDWYLIHHVLAVLLFLGGALFGYFQGQYWWRQIYVLKRFGSKN